MKGRSLLLQSWTLSEPLGADPYDDAAVRLPGLTLLLLLLSSLILEVVVVVVVVVEVVAIIIIIINNMIIVELPLITNYIIHNCINDNYQLQLPLDITTIIISIVIMSSSSRSLVITGTTTTIIIMCFHYYYYSSPTRPAAGRADPLPLPGAALARRRLGRRLRQDRQYTII